MRFAADVSTNIQRLQLTRDDDDMQIQRLIGQNGGKIYHAQSAHRGWLHV
jgi:hypothetical protein